MTRIRLIAISIFIICLLSGCGASAKTVSEPDGTPLDIVYEVIGSQTDIPPLEILTPDDGEFANYLTQIYGIPEEGLTDGAVGYAGGIEASEIAVLVFSDEDTAGAAQDSLLNYIQSRVDSFAGYVPDQAALAENGMAVRQGRCAALLLCGDPAAAREAFLACFEAGWKPKAQPDEPPSQTPDVPDGAPEPLELKTEHEAAELPARDGANTRPEGESEAGNQAKDNPAVPPEEPAPPSPPEDAPAAPDVPDTSELSDISELSDTSDLSDTPEDEGSGYDRAAIVSAWRSGDPSGLSEKNRAVYDAAANVISQVIKDEMIPYQKELAIHDYLTARCRYDPEANSNAPDASPDPDNGNPYGMLIHGVGICQGYSSTFELFMNLLDIECVTVSGRSGSREHAWNMVRLDGEWYCVDVTWDDPSGGSPGHRYFNVTSQFLRENSHQWETDGVPEADAVRWAYQS